MMLSSKTAKFFSRSTLQNVRRLALTTSVQATPVLAAQPRQMAAFSQALPYSTGAPKVAQDTATVIAENEYEIVGKDSGKLWVQLKELIYTQRWTTQDEGTLSLLASEPNVINLFIVRKADQYLLGGVVLIETPDLVYGNVYIMREGYRAAGMGMKLIRKFQEVLHKAFQSKPLIARGVPAMMGKYAGPPFYASLSYKLFSYEFKDKQDLKEFFPAPATHPYTLKSVKDLTSEDFKQMMEYDKLVTGVDRTVFLTKYYGFDFIQGVVAFDSNNQIRGMAALSPTTNEDGLFKLNPVYAENQDDCCTLIHAAADLTNHPNAHYVLHSREQSAGDWMLKKCADTGRKTKVVGALCIATNMNQPYTDPSRTDLMFSPTNSPAHFDG